MIAASLKSYLRNNLPLLFKILSKAKRALKTLLVIPRSIMKIPLSFTVAFSSNHLIVNWFHHKNFGDALSPVIAATLTGKKIVNVESIYNFRKMPIYSVVGSVIERGSRYPQQVVLGSGCIEDSAMTGFSPASVAAVRGPLSRDKLMDSGCYCPEVYGDPALLCPFLYSPDLKKRYKLGIIAHYIDSDSDLLDLFSNRDEVTIIDIERPIIEVIDRIAECEIIASSSLHGLIVADAYKIPTTWIKITDKVFGGEFKFNDYYQSLGRGSRKPLVISSATTLEEIISLASNEPIEIDLERLIQACPLPGVKVKKLEDLRKLKEEFKRLAERR